MSYGPNLPRGLYPGRDAVLVDKILKCWEAGRSCRSCSRKTFELILNLKTATRWGIQIPPSRCWRGRRVIE